MKKFVIILGLAAGVSACSSNANNSSGSHNTFTIKDSVKIIRDSLRLDSFERAEAAKKEDELRERELEAAKAEGRKEGVASAPKNVTVVNHNPGTTSSTTTTQQQQKKGWSAAAKGAAIGAGAGAVTGILIDKKDGRGAAIGGAIGAGTGYLIGRKKDKESGRAK